MNSCRVCKAEIPAGSRWCGICRTHTLSPEIGKLATPGRRFGAYLLDWTLPLLAVLMVFVVIGIGAAAGSEDGAVLGALIGSLLFLSYIVWAIALFFHGTTPGKKTFGMRVVNERGVTAGLFTMLLREWIGKAISAWVLSMGFIWILIDKENQGWHDKFASTFVVQFAGTNRVFATAGLALFGVILVTLILIGVVLFAGTSRVEAPFIYAM